MTTDKKKFTLGSWNDISKICRINGNLPMDEQLANAALISASPLMYEALEWALGVVTDRTVYEKIKKALSAAEGKE